MSCIVHETLIKRWFQLSQRPPDAESAYLQVEEHRDACEMCRNERAVDQLVCEQSVKVTFVMRFPVSK